MGGACAVVGSGRGQRGAPRLGAELRAVPQELQRDAASAKYIDWLYNLESHEMASLSLLWNVVALLPATAAISWHAPLRLKVIPFGILAAATIAVNDRMAFEAMEMPAPLRYRVAHWVVAIVNALQLLIPSPVRDECVPGGARKSKSS